MRTRALAVLAALAVLPGLSIAVPAQAVSLLAAPAPAVTSEIRKPVARAGEYVKGIPTAATEAKAKGSKLSAQRLACPPVCYHYATALRQASGTTNTGVTQVAGIVSQHKPYRGSEFHTIWEVAIVDHFAAGGENRIEAGWNVDNAVNGDDNPHFFVYNLVNGGGGCYNGCGWLDNPNENAVNAGTSLAYTACCVTPTAYYQYRIERVTGRPSWCTGATCTAGWGVGVNGWQIIQKNQGAADRIPGGFPDTHWTSAGASFTAAPEYQMFWELASGGTTPCADMGAGTYGSGTLPHSSADLLAASDSSGTTNWDSVSVDPAGDSPSAFRVFDGAGYGTPDPDRVRGGGPGWNAAGTGAGSVGSC
jgi:hypothetical protein